VKKRQLKRLRRRLLDHDEIEIDHDERNALVRALTAKICDGFGARWIARLFENEDRATIRRRKRHG
jgi:hypothetical protein